jgi:HTH-type transcriptional regulator/antitoxin HigA
MMTRRPAEVFPPGEILRDELEARGWSQSDFAEIMGRPPATVSDLVSGRRSISPEMARGLAAALGTSPEFWMNLDATYQLSRVRDSEEDTIARRARLYEKVPVKEMVRRGWIEPSDNVAVLESRVLKFLRIENIDDDPEAPLHAARKSTTYRNVTPGQLVWLLRAHQLARAVSAKPYSEKSLKDAVERLRPHMQAIQEVRHVPRILSEAGIRLVIVQPLPGSRIDGASFWLDQGPVIAMTLRFDRIDNFWFVLMHELGHISKGEESLDSDLDAIADDSDRPESERNADAFALESLVPQHRLEGFIARIRPLYSARRIEAFAHTVGVHPAIVIGQLQHRGEIAYSSFRKTMEPVRGSITTTALTDGWGTALPAHL